MPTPDPAPIKLSTFCDRIGVDEREVRYALARGIVPAGMRQNPGRGHHREFDARQAFWLAIVLRLKAAGIQTPLAGEVAGAALTHLRGAAQALGWDWTFSPFAGQLQSDHTWLLEVADGASIRLTTDANPSAGGRLVSLPWVGLPDRQPREILAPIVLVQLNLTRLAQLLAEPPAAGA